MRYRYVMALFAQPFANALSRPDRPVTPAGTPKGKVQ
jgi:hypothetical protein